MRAGKPTASVVWAFDSYKARRRVGAAEQPGHPRQGVDLDASPSILDKTRRLPSHGQPQLVDVDGGDVDCPGRWSPGDVAPGPVGDDAAAARLGGDHAVTRGGRWNPVAQHRGAEQGER